jgi:hypothetical protein
MRAKLKARLSAWRARAIGCLPARWRGVFLYPPGHFYSPLTDFARFDAATERFLGDDEKAWEHIDLHLSGQREFYTKLIGRTRHLPFPDAPDAAFRYYAGNDMFVFGDAFVLSGQMQQLRPRRVIEIGSGFSSAVMLDTADACGLETTFTFVEILPQRLRRLLRADDDRRVTVDRRPVQDLAPSFFDALDSGDILFIDSSHVAKVGSDVTHLLLRILPRLRCGVRVHIHDIFYPETYPSRWMRQGRAWNESLFVRAFLLHNRDYRIRAFNAFAARKFPEVFRERMPRFLADSGGSLWLEKVA